MFAEPLGRNVLVRVDVEFTLAQDWLPSRCVIKHSLNKKKKEKKINEEIRNLIFKTL